mgnify:CR=1 FL=1
MAEKLFYTMGEVSEMFDVKPSLLRYWEEQFPTLRPKRNKKGNRLYSPQDVEQLKTIYHLVKERGMTIDGAKKALREQRKEGTVARNAQLMERLQRIRALLLEVREDLKSDGEEILPEEISETPETPAAPAVEKEGKVVVKFDEPASEPTEKPKTRRPRKKKADAETKELFAFLIDRNGASVTSAEICAKLWENGDEQNKQNYIHQLFRDLRQALEGVGADAVFLRNNYTYSIVPEKIDCDYFSYLKTGNPKFRGEYMSQYSWAEETCGLLWDNVPPAFFHP